MSATTLDATEAVPLEAALTRLRLVVPEATDRAERALETALTATWSSCWPEVAWRASSLTNTGFPVELSWSSRETAVRWTAEPAGPEIAMRERLSAALTVLRTLGVDGDVPDWLVPRRDQEFRFGAWIGGRHDALRDRYKLYVDLAGTDVPRALVLEGVPSRTIWRMAGIEIGTGILELYGRLAKPEIWEVENLLVRAGLKPAPIIEIAAHLTGSARAESLLPGTGGLSLAMLGGHVVAAGFLVHASALLGSDESIAGKLRELARHYSWNIALYDALLGQAPTRPPTRHGMIGFGVRDDVSAWMQIGIRP
jgi:hypothetical protein